jgi:sterol desaturase/sphingolipid hydroxylase (fatty acid hydroxylase superfamily)
MMGHPLEHEAAIRAASFTAVLIAMLIWQAAAPRRRPVVPQLRRIANNLAVVGINTILTRVAFPVLPAGMAVIAQSHHWGLFNIVEVPYGLMVFTALVVLDLTMYGQHVLFHAVPSLWRVHRMHHADRDFDATTGVRFHPIEIVLSTLFKIAVVIVLGPPIEAVIAFEVLLNASSMFNHGNARIALWFDRQLRRAVVTPDMHRVHHSIRAEETQHNFGFNLSIWDRLFGTYQDQPRDGHEAMTIGVEGFTTEADVRLRRMLLQPWQAPAGNYPILRVLR